MSPKEHHTETQATPTPGQQASRLIDLLSTGLAETAPPPSPEVERLLELGLPIRGVVNAPQDEVRPAPPQVEPEPVSEPQPDSSAKRVRRAAVAIVNSGAKMSLLLLCAYAFLFNFSVVRGNSMEPGIHDGDRILVNHLGIVFTDVTRGDIVVLRYPLDPTVDYIKRVVGVPGDRIVIEDGEVVINGEPMSEPYVQQPDPYTKLDVEVLDGHYFVLGDNRMHSSDSREFGQVPAAYLRGRVDIRVWPPSRVGTVR